MNLHYVRDLTPPVDRFKSWLVQRPNEQGHSGAVEFILIVGRFLPQIISKIYGLRIKIKVPI